MANTVRNPRYWGPVLVLICVIAAATLLRAGGSDGAQASARAESRTPAATPLAATPAPTSSPVAKATPGFDAVLHDAARSVDLGVLKDALTQYYKRFGSYPTTANEVAPVCARPTDAGCALFSVSNKLPLADEKQQPYRYASDGATYFVLIARVWIPVDMSDCPAVLPPDLTPPLLCVLVKGVP